MKLFVQTAKCNIDRAISSAFFERLPEVISKQTGWHYICQHKANGCVLKPTFKNMPYRNSFVPEIDIEIFFQDTQMFLHINGRPVPLVFFFMIFWCCSLLATEALLLVLAITSNLDSIFPVFIPIGMCVFGYLLCQLATKATFRSVVKAIQKECS